MIESSMLKDFIYDQGDKVCSQQDQTKCDDQFSYIPYGEWVGYGDYQKTEIKLTPVFGESSVSAQTSSDTPVTSQLKKDSAVVSNANTGTCQDNTAVMIALCLISVTLLVPIGVLVSKIKSMNSEESSTEMSKFDSTQSKQALKLHEYKESAEAELKKEGDEN